MKSRSVLLTGATGYVGGVIAAKLAGEGVAVHALVRPHSAGGDQFRRTYSITRHPYTGDYASVEAAALRGPFSAIIHFAGAGRLHTPSSELGALIEVSVTLPTYLLAAAANGCSPRVILAGSYWEWSNGPGSAPNSVYGSAKVAARAIADYYAAFRQVEAVELALHDVYGPDDRRPKLFNLLANCALTGDVLDMTAGDQLLAPIHVDDVCRAVSAAIELPSTDFDSTRCATFAVHGPKVMSLREIVEVYQRAVGTSIAINWGAKPYPVGQIMQPCLVPMLPNWRPKIRLEQGLRETFREVAHGQESPD